MGWDCSGSRGCAVSGAGETCMLSRVSRGVLGGASSMDWDCEGGRWLGVESEGTLATGPLSDVDMASRE